MGLKMLPPRISNHDAPSDREVAASVPRGIDILVQKAAVDEQFKTVFLDQPVAAAGTIGLTLGETEVALLKAVPREQLATMVAHIRVAPRIQVELQGQSAASMVDTFNKSSHKYVRPMAVMGAIVGRLEAAKSLALPMAILAVLVLPAMLLWRWIRRRTRMK